MFLFLDWHIKCMTLFVFGTQSACLEIINKILISQVSYDHQGESEFAVVENGLGKGGMLGE